MSADIDAIPHGADLIATSSHWSSVVPAPERTDLTWHQADELTRRIRRHLMDLKAMLEAASDLVDAASVLLDRAWATRADEALGYSSFEAYCAEQFGSLGAVRLPVPERVQLVMALYGSGERMSVRGASRVMGIADQTGRADVRRGTPPAPVVQDEVAPPEPKVDHGSPRAATKPALVLAALAAAPRGLTAPELDRAHGWRHGTAGAVLSELHRGHRLARSVETRDGYALYLALEHAAGREVEAPGRRSRQRAAAA